jgi:hypothetical protein
MHRHLYKTPIHREWSIYFWDSPFIKWDGPVTKGLARLKTVWMQLLDVILFLPLFVGQPGVKQNA